MSNYRLAYDQCETNDFLLREKVEVMNVNPEDGV